MKAIFWTTLFWLLVILSGSLYFKLKDPTLIEQFFCDVSVVSESNVDLATWSAQNLSGIFSKLEEMDEKLTNKIDSIEKQMIEYKEELNSEKELLKDDSLTDSLWSGQTMTWEAQNENKIESTWQNGQ